MTYQDIAENGGGIAATVLPTRKASDSQLAHLGVERMREALRNGTTHMETKSGYGLDTESELRLLSIAENLAAIENLPSLDLTWLGAHSAPQNRPLDDYYEEIFSEQLPAVIEQGDSKERRCFCEPGWFTIEQTEEIMKSSKKGA